MSENTFENLLKKALVLETQERTMFLEGIDNLDYRNKIEALLSDDTQLTEFLVQTAAGFQAITPAKIQDLKAGDKVKQFLIKKLIAKGGMGSVYLAYDEKLKRNVAIKTIRAEFRLNQASHKRFEKEAQILSQINHPSICQIYDYIDYEDGDLLVLELVDGHTLNDCQLDSKNLLDLFIQIASALEVAHQQGIIHRDLKPDNIMLTPSGQVKILDFGIAKSNQKPLDIKPKPQSDKNTDLEANNELTKAGSIMGTLIYMSPEQAEGQQISTASDIYSVAIIMQRLLTGDYPYTFTDTHSLRKQIINAELINYEKLDKDYQSLIASMTSKNPCNRPTAALLQKKLNAIQNKPINKKRRLKKILLTVSLVLLMGLLTWQFRQSQIQQTKTNIKMEAYEKINQANQIIEKAYTLPNHNIENELSQASQIIKQLEIDQLELLDMSEKVKLHAEALYAIKQYNKAIPKFELAWSLGQQDSILADKMATSYLMKYWQDHFSNNELKEHSDSIRQKALLEKHTLLNKASKYFQIAKQGQQHVDLDLIEAYKLYANSEFQQALQHIDSNQAKVNGDYIKLNLLGNIHFQLYYTYYTKDDLETANQHLSQAQKAFKEAIQFGRSYQDSYINLCNVNIEHLENIVYENFQANNTLYESTYSSCKQAIEISPSNSFSINKITELIMRYTDFLVEIGTDTSDKLQVALDWNNKALEIDPSPYTYKMRAFIFDSLAVAKINSGHAADKEIRSAMQAYNKAIEIEPKLLAKHSSNILYTLLNKVEYQYDRGEDLYEAINYAQEVFQKAVDSKLDTLSENLYLYVNLASIQNIMAQSERSKKKHKQALDWIEKSLTTYKTVLNQPVNLSFVKSGILENHILKAKIELYYGHDVSLLIKQIRQEINELEEELSPYAWFQLIRADFELIKLNKSISDNQPTSDHLIQLKQWVKQSIELNSRHPEPYFRLAESYYIELILNSSNEQELFQEGLKAINKALSINPNKAVFIWLKALLLEQAKKSNLIVSEELNKANKLKNKAKQINPMIVNYSVFD